jgi:hypothetical protein
MVPSGLIVTIPFVGAPTPEVGTVGKVTFVRSAADPSGFLSLVKTGIFVGIPATSVMLSGLAMSVGSNTNT